MPLSEFATSGQVLFVESRILGEAVVWAADNARVPEDEERVVYRTRELRQLVGATEAELRSVHTAKEALDGKSVGFAEERAAVKSGTVVS